ncbi:MAG: 16S rRNA processing protein RimM [Acidobacteria bacterium]|nr:16S rRNA processing protein RimM [Acidobacteriota bacterium]
MPAAPRTPSGPHAAAPQYVTLARILRPRGRIGEVSAYILTDFPERLTNLREVFLSDPNRPALPPKKIRVRRCWLHIGRVVFHFEGVDSINDAEKLKGLDVQVPISERVSLPAGRYFVSDLIGCEVWEATATGNGMIVGIVDDVQLNTGTPLLVVKTLRGELLIPLADEICTRIDVSARRIEVRLPEGLREINES